MLTLLCVFFVSPRKTYREHTNYRLSDRTTANTNIIRTKYRCENIRYGDLISAQGNNFAVKIPADQLGKIIVLPIFYSANVNLETNTAVITVKEYNKEIICQALGYDSKKIAQQSDKLINSQKYKRLKDYAASSNTKLSYMIVTKIQLELLKMNEIELAAFPKDDGKYNVAFMPDTKELITKILYPSDDSKQESEYERNSRINNEIKRLAAINGEKPKYRMVAPELLDNIKQSGIQFAYFKKGDKYNIVFLRERYEIRHNTSEPDRITEWFGDYAMYASKKLDREEMNNIFATKFVKLLLDEWFNGFRGEKSIEKEFFEHISRLNSECFKNSLPNNLEDWEKAIINELEGVSKQVASGNIPILQERTKIYIDMDGTIARFHDENLYLERMFEKGFFIDLKPFENAVYAIEQLVNDSTAEIFILSATVNSCSLDEKQKWLDRYLPNIDKEHRIFTSLNVPKSEAIGHRLTDKDILIDDYNKNLLEWQKAGGTSVKAKNNINHKGLHGELWKGELIDVVNGDVYSDICKLANENYYYAYIGENDVEKLKNSGICYHLQMSGDRIIAKVSIAYKPILDNIVNSNRSIKCDTGSTPKM